MSVTPLLKPLRVDGGTLYAFQPAMKDLSLMFSNNENIKFNFSKFVCIKLPNWANTTMQSAYIDPNKIESVNDNSAADDVNTFFVKAYLQNYAENLNTILDKNREDNNFANTAELALFKALSSTYNNAQPPLQFEEHSTFLDTNNVVRNIYREASASAEYEPIIQYIGDINLTNAAKSDGDEYLEVFGYIPTGSGKLIDVQFLQNLQINPTLAQVPAETGAAWIEGQQNNYENSTAKSYAGAVYDTATNKYNVSTDKDLLQIDWNDLEKPESAYKRDNGNFDFNAVLVYYDLFDKNDQTTVSRNLYGIFIIDSFDMSSPTSTKIPTFTKYQPDENQSGNSYAFRFNLMFSNSSNIVSTANVINDYSTYSMELYMHALEVLNRIALQYGSSSKIAIDAAAKIARLETLLLSIESSTGERQAFEAASKANQAANDVSAIVDQVQSAVDTANTLSQELEQLILDIDNAVDTANSAASTATQAASNVSTAIDDANTATSNALSAASAANGAAASIGTVIDEAETATQAANDAASNATTATTNANNAAQAANDAAEQFETLLEVSQTSFIDGTTTSADLDIDYPNKPAGFKVLFPDENVLAIKASTGSWVTVSTTSI